MARELEVRREQDLPATPEQVWDAVATGMRQPRLALPDGGRAARRRKGHARRQHRRGVGAAAPLRGSGHPGRRVLQHAHLPHQCGRRRREPPADGNPLGAHGRRRRHLELGHEGGRGREARRLLPALPPRVPEALHAAAPPSTSGPPVASPPKTPPTSPPCADASASTTTRPSATGCRSTSRVRTAVRRRWSWTG